MEKQNRTRNKQLLFRVTPKEKELIQEKMRLLNMTNFNAYAREMLKKGYIVNKDITELKNLSAELQKIDVNLRQILRYVDTLGTLYADDAAELRQKMRECWDMMRKLFKEHTRLTK